MQAPRLVASDVDGTLLDSAEQVPPRAAAAITRLVDAGVGFVLVTGRPARWIPPIVAQLPVARLAVCANGGVLFDAVTDEVLWSRTFAPEQLAELAAVVLDVLPDAGLAVERVDRPEPGRGSSGPAFLADPGYRHAWPDGDNVVVDRSELVAAPAVKLLVRNAQLSSDAMVTALHGPVGDRAHLTFSHSRGLIEASPLGVDKATGLAAVAAHLKIPAADVLAFGDMPNDLAMLSWAGHGVAMGNAHPAVHEVADEITASNDEDGLALVLERWF